MPLTRFKTVAQREVATRRLQRLARWLDYAFVLPVLKKKIGWDGIFGLVPVVGDIAMAALSLWIVYQGWRLGASWKTLARMLLNVGVDLLVGEIPVAGDVFDFFWRANRMNIALLGIDVDAAEDRSKPLPRVPRA